MLLKENDFQACNTVFVKIPFLREFRNVGQFSRPAFRNQIWQNS